MQVCFVSKNLTTLLNSSFDLRKSLLGLPFSCHAMQKLGNFKCALLQYEDPFELKLCELSSSYRVFRRVIFNFGIIIITCMSHEKQELVVQCISVKCLWQISQKIS